MAHGFSGSSADRMLNRQAHRKRAPANRRSSLSSSLLRLVSAADAHVVDSAIGGDHAAEAEVGRIGGAVAKRAVGAHAVRTVAVRGVAAAAREPTNGHHAVTARADSGEDRKSVV